MENIHPALNSSGVGHGQAKPPAPAPAPAVPNAGLDGFVDIHYEDVGCVRLLSLFSERVCSLFILLLGIVCIFGEKWLLNININTFTNNHHRLRLRTRQDLRVRVHPQHHLRRSQRACGFRL